MPLLQPGETYTVQAVESDIQLPGRPAPLTDEERERYLQLPDVPMTRVAALARQITVGAASDEQRLTALMRWFGDHKRYTLQPAPVPRNREAVSYFLFNMRSGWCRHFAASMGVMARQLGIPTRVISGYTEGDQEGDNHYIVRARHAHAWVECWLPDRGWVVYDPTAMAVEELTGLAYVFDWARETWRRSQRTVVLLSLPVVLALLAVGGFLGARRWWRGPGLALASSRRRRRPTGPGSDPEAERLLRRWLGLLRGLGLARGASETERVLATRAATLLPVAAEAQHRLADLIAYGRFSGRPLGAERRAEAEAALRRVRAALRERRAR
jgi:hypothetical protein